jgi:hypothetical protein
MWISLKEAGPAELGPSPDSPEPPLGELFFYAGTRQVGLPVDLSVYLTTFNIGKPQVQFISYGKEKLAVLVVPGR